jgi:hypothetical protein
MVRNARRRRDRRAQLGVVVLAAVAGVIAGFLGTHRAWERPPAAPPTSTTVPAHSPHSGPAAVTDWYPMTPHQGSV